MSTERDMGYELDGIFATRNQGQMISAEQPDPVIVRTGTELSADTVAAAPASNDIVLPVIGAVSKKTLLLAGVAAALGAYLLLRKRKAK